MSPFPSPLRRPGQGKHPATIRVEADHVVIVQAAVLFLAEGRVPGHGGDFVNHQADSVLLSGRSLAVGFHPTPETQGDRCVSVVIHDRHDRVAGPRRRRPWNDQPQPAACCIAGSSGIASQAHHAFTWLVSVQSGHSTTESMKAWISGLFRAFVGQFATAGAPGCKPRRLPHPVPRSGIGASPGPQAGCAVLPHLGRLAARRASWALSSIGELSGLVRLP